MDDASSVFDASILTGPIANYPVADSFNRALERDYSTGDIPHVFVSSVVWDLPAGAGRARQPHGVLGALANDWTVTALVTLQSGVPVAVTQTTNFNAFAGFGVQRPNLVGDPTLPADQRTPSHWFNTAAFAVAPQFTLGIGVAQSGPRPVVPRRRPRADAPRAGRRRARRSRCARRSSTCSTRRTLGAPGGRARRGELRHDHHARSTRASCSWRVKFLF